MSRSRHRLLPSLLAALLLALGLSSCGGSNGSDSITHIQGSSATITKPMLDHWMRETVANDFRANVGTKAPVGLVLEPANYPQCAEAAKKVIRRSYTGRLVLSDAEISQKCHQLYQAIKAETLAYLLSVQWTTLEGEEQGITVSDAEVRQQFKRFAKSFYKSQAAQRSYLAERHMVVADVLYKLRRNMLATRLQPRLLAEVKKAGGGERNFTRLALDRYHGLIAKTSCKPGYVVFGCREYRPPAVALPSPSVILEGFAGAVG
jgi:hypothetical protein